MGKKIKLTERQHQLIVNKLIEERLSKGETLDEGLLDAIKNGIANLMGRYNVGGKKFWQRSAIRQIDQEYAEKIKNIIDKKGNEVIKNLDAKIKETDPKFPNSDNQQQFLTTVMEIAAVYDSIVAATKKNPNEEGYLPVDIANGVIEDLRTYVKKALDIDLKSFYATVNEGEDKIETLTEEKLKQIDEYFGLTEADPMDAADVRAGLQAKRDAQGGGEDFASTKRDQLKSNTLPLTLAGIGASLGAFSWLVNTEWFKSLFDVVTKNPSIEYIKQAVQEKTEVLASIKPNEGMTQIMNRLNGMNLNPNSSPQEFINGVKALGGGNVNAGIDALTQQGGIFANPDAARKALTEIVNNPNAHGSNLGQIFQGQWAGTGESFGDSLVTQTGGNLKGMIVNTIIKAVPKLVIKTGIKTGAGYALAKGFGAVLGPIGVAALIAGATVKLMRMKGQKSSRFATLDALYQSIRNLEGGLGLEPNADDTGNQDGGQGGTGKPAPQQNVKTNLYNNLKSLFQFIVNNKNTMGSEIRGGAGTGGASAFQTQNYNKVSWRTKNGVKTGKLLGVGKTMDTSKVQSDETGKILNIKTKSLKKLNPNQVSEARYIKDKYLINALSKSLPFDKLKNFEELLSRVELIRNSLKKMRGNSGDKTLDNFLKQLDSNPIMVTDFSQLMTVDPNNAQEVNQLLAFIKEILLGVYSGNYKLGGMVDKMSTLGGGNINKVSEEEMDEAAAYSATQPNKAFTQDAQNRGRFKNNLIKFLSTAMNMFQYLHRTQGGQIARKDTTNKYVPVDRQELSNKLGKKGLGLPTTTRQKSRATQQAPAAPTNKNVVPENLDPKLMEELKRIKKIMLS